MQPGDTPHPRSIEQDQILLDALADLGFAFAQDLRPQPDGPRPNLVQSRILIESFQQVARIVRRTILLKHSLPRIAARAATAARDPAVHDPAGHDPAPRDPSPKRDPAPRDPDAEPRMRLDEIDTLRSDLAALRLAPPRPPAPSRPNHPPAPSRPINPPAPSRPSPRPAPPPIPAMTRLTRDIIRMTARPIASCERTLVPAGIGPPPRPPNPD